MVKVAHAVLRAVWALMATRVVHLRTHTFLAPLLILSGCGYIADTLPPSLNLPTKITDLTALERGSKIVIQFTVPQKSTEGLVLKEPPELDLRIGLTLADARRLPDVPTGKLTVRYETTAAEWYGKDIVIGVKALNARGRDAGWSNPVTLSVIPELPKPADLKLDDVPGGVQLTWQSPSKVFRVYRREAGQSNWIPLTTVSATTFTDITTEYGKAYRYYVQALADTGSSPAESDLSDEKEITPKDIFPPAVPTGLVAVVSTKSIELVWDRNTETDLAGYRVYRAVATGPFELISDTRDAPSFSDSKIESGKAYRYAVSAVDKLNNESKQSAPTEATAP